MFYVYTLQSRKRLIQHGAGKVFSTKNKRFMKQRLSNYFKGQS